MPRETIDEEQMRITGYLTATPEEQAKLRITRQMDILSSLASAAIEFGSDAEFEVHRQALCRLTAAHPNEHAEWLRSRLQVS